MRVAVVDNTAVSSLGQVGVALAEAGAGVSRYRPYLDGRLPEDPGGHDALVVLGGEQSALDDDLHPYLAALARLMRIYSDLDKAVLGICLGAQVLARGYGGTNLLGSATEFGWRSVARRRQGARIRS